jgi:hypothetical protein
MAMPHQGQRRAISGSLIGISDCEFRISDFARSRQFLLNLKPEQPLSCVGSEIRIPKSAIRNSNAVHGRISDFGFCAFTSVSLKFEARTATLLCWFGNPNSEIRNPQFKRGAWR